jgi:hypothetical protein
MLEILIAIVPLLALLAALLLGHYPGCEAVLRLSDRIHRRPRHRRLPTTPPAPRAPLAFAPAGGLLIAFGLARRPPPLAP